jgi:hypothetical protein
MHRTAGMSDVVLPLGVLAILLMFVAQVRRLIAHAILNRTIRKALEIDAPSARLLIEKLEPRPRWPDGLAGWIMVVAGVAIGAASPFAPHEEVKDLVQIAAVSVVIGGGILLYAWWVERSTPKA